jgi:hypothetical protein
MAPGQARRFVERAVAAGVLVEAADGLHLSVDPATVDVPRRYRPDPDAPFEGAPARAAPVASAAPATPAASTRAGDEDPFLAWVERIGGDRAAVLAEVAARQDRLGGLLEALPAVLWLAAEEGHDVQEASQQAVRQLQSAPEARPPG